ncbi:hypothetical protein [Nocardia yamanashiensis]|uniref:hypothetical protein n=1 Tax=Nocardia yamanashiensis TaxID=209247 RepID=UPI000A83FBAC|nr:hypothetical protein [Nocardia yamanashiensis]
MAIDRIEPTGNQVLFNPDRFGKAVAGIAEAANEMSGVAIANPDIMSIEPKMFGELGPAVARFHRSCSSDAESATRTLRKVASSCSDAGTAFEQVDAAGHALVTSAMTGDPGSTDILSRLTHTHAIDQTQPISVDPSGLESLTQKLDKIEQMDRDLVELMHRGEQMPPIPEVPPKVLGAEVLGESRVEGRQG